MRVLVLNSAYQPINVTTLARGFKLVFKGKAEVIEHIEDEPIVTSQRNYKRPTVIRLLRYISIPFRKVTLSRQNIYRRDDYKCVYCNSKDNLTLDHVVPKSKGGANSWTNLVTCCSDCNIRKGDKDLDDFLLENDYEMKYEPFKPHYIYFIENLATFHDSWKIYVGIIA
jgi:5-methylcytosine-specific restriction endonuclease McrA